MIRHCVGAGGGPRSCERVDRDYNIPLRVGVLFAVLVASALGKQTAPTLNAGIISSPIGVFLPVYIVDFMPPKANLLLPLLKQFGTGVIISTSFVHVGLLDSIDTFLITDRGPP